MKTAYAIGSGVLGGLGIGRIAYHAVLGLYEAGLLRWAACMAFSNGSLSKNKVKVFPFPSRKIFPFLSVNRYVQFSNHYFDLRVSKLLQKDVLLFHGWNGSCLLSLKRAKQLGLCTVLERASAHPAYQKKILEEEYTKFGLTYPYDKVLYERMLLECDLADHILVPSEFAYNSFKEIGFTNMDKIHIIPFGVNLEHFKPVPKPDKPFTVLFTGQVSFRKGVLYLLQAWEKLNLKDAQLFIVGGMHPDIKPFLEKHRKHSNVVFAGHQENVKPFYDKAHVCVFPSVEDGFGLVLLEAMECGVPSIITPFLGACEHITHGQDGWVVPVGGVDSISEAILFFYNNPEKREEMGRRARVQAQAFSWKVYGEKMVNKYKEFLS